ncbi:uncharacterized protein PgNI_12210 [Pyricularia grisea]|uniref:Uncharacterized protein n=1 Tax=Pyricularia grisea TaxID=148305 RepID=A0A6P8AR58_PYRGI|nr:uncharacterized protein PgNI_12210 [Pyricularia grisea]TLD04539.1 hypothetical protein PgNI_12210 [Pyricularia grisea]
MDSFTSLCHSSKSSSHYRKLALKTYQERFEEIKQLNMPEHHEHPPSGVTDTAADSAHEFIEGAEEQEHKAHPEAQLDRGMHQETAESGSKGLGATENEESHSKSKMESIKEALHLKKDDK